MALADSNPDSLAKKFFVITMVGVALYVGFVLTIPTLFLIMATVIVVLLIAVVILIIAQVNLKNFGVPLGPGTPTAAPQAQALQAGLAEAVGLLVKEGNEQTVAGDQALERLQDQVASFPTEEARAIVTRELGRPIDEARSAMAARVPRISSRTL